MAKKKKTAAKKTTVKKKVSKKGKKNKNKNKTAKKSTKIGRPAGSFSKGTITELVVNLLEVNPASTGEAILKKVLAKFPDSAFKIEHAFYYRSQYGNHKLPRQKAFGKPGTNETKQTMKGRVASNTVSKTDGTKKKKSVKKKVNSKSKKKTAIKKKAPVSKKKTKAKTKKAA